MASSYEKILKKLSELSKVSEEEIDRQIESKREKFSGLITREGALQIIASNLGVSFDNESLKIDELLPEMRKVNFVGKITKLFPVRTFTTKSGDEGKVANMYVADDTSNIKIVLWDVNHISSLENQEIKEGDSIEVIGGRMRQNEVHLGGFSEFKKSRVVFADVRTEKVVTEAKLAEINLGDRIKVRAFVVQSYDPRFFEANKETGRKVTEEELANGVPTEKRAILNVVIDDGTENIRAVMFHEMVKKIGLNKFDEPEELIKQKEDLLGKELIFIATVKNNSYFNNAELIVEDIEQVDLDVLEASL